MAAVMIGKSEKKRRKGMKKNYQKKIAAFIIMVFMLAIVAGCGGGAKDTGDKAGDKADAINVGINVELSGGVASYGTNAKDGAVLAIEQINADGGVLVCS
jgi:branched-chain amino acid transport system substrate-binding protein